MRLVVGMLALTALVACRDDDRAGTTSTTSHVMIPEPTAADQSNEANDLALAGEIRRTLVTDEQIGLRGKNVVVVVRNGVVTLRGEVPTAAQHDRVVARVASVPGVVRLDDRITPHASNYSEGANR